MKIAVIGAGRMGRAVAFSLLSKDPVDHVILVDQSTEALYEAEADLPGRRISTVRAAADDIGRLREVFASVDGAVGAAHYAVNLALTQLAIETGTHFCDLGGNNTVVAQQFDLNDEAEQAEVSILPDCGLAPGLVSVLTAAGVERFDRVESVKLRVGGIPLRPRLPLNYFVVFSPSGLINEYIEPCMVLRGSDVVHVPPMSELEAIVFPAPFGEMEAFTTSGGASTLPLSFAGRIADLDYKTIRYPGHAQLVQSWITMGLTSSEPVMIEGQAVRPRSLLEHLVSERLTKDGPDAVLLRATLSGSRDGRPFALEFELIDEEDPETGLTAMARCTAFPAAVAIRTLVAGDASRHGVLRQEEAFAPRPYIDALRRLGLEIRETWRVL